MKKGLKITLIVLGVLIGVIILDTSQAKVFDNSPILKIRDNLDGGSLDYIDKGIFVNHYHCNNNEDVTTWKGTKFACSVKEISLNDINDKIINFISNNQESNTNYAYNYIDNEKQVIVVGLVDANENNQHEFITNVFSNCCGSEYIHYIKNNNLIEFNESKDVFEAKIIVAEKDYITVEVLKDSNSLKKDDKVTMKVTRPTDGTNDFYIVGNKVRITFNGLVLDSNPIQIGAVNIELI